MMRQISIKKIDKPRGDLKEEVRWIIDSLGLISGRDTEETSFQIFYEFLKKIDLNDRAVASQSIAKGLGIETSRVNHHVRIMVNSGVVFREKKRIRLRGGSLVSALGEMRRDIDRVFEDLIKTSEEIDKALRF